MIRGCDLTCPRLRACISSWILLFFVWMQSRNGWNLGRSAVNEHMMVSFRTRFNSGGPCSNRLDRHGRFYSCCFVIYTYTYTHIYIYFLHYWLTKIAWMLLLTLVLFSLSSYSACVVEDSLGGWRQLVFLCVAENVVLKNVSGVISLTKEM